MNKKERIVTELMQICGTPPTLLDLDPLPSLPPLPTIPAAIPPNAKTYQVTVSKTDKSGNVIQKTYNKRYYVMSEEDKLAKMRTCRAAKTKLMVEIRKKLKEFENDYDALAGILDGLRELSPQVDLIN